MQANAFERMHELAREVLPTGVGASARFNPDLGYPLYVERGDGARLYGVDGREYIDFNMSHGATFLGHNHPATKAAIQKALDLGVVCAYETEHHQRLARTICEVVPCAERVRYTNTGTESTLVALRMARKYTGKNKLVKFEGHFHGLHEFVMYNAHTGTGEYTAKGYIEPMVESAGVPEGMKDYVIVLPWNDLESLEMAFEQDGDDIAAVIMEPLNYNSGGLVATKEYMQGVREITAAHDAPLIYDEVLSALRTGPGSGQEYYGVTPDMCVMAKAIANGVPLAFVAGKKELMDTVTAGVAHSGTYTSHLFGIMASQAVFEEIRKPGFYDHIYAVADKLYSALQEAFDRHGVPARVQGVGARFGIYFGIREEVKSFRDADDFDADLAGRFYRACFEEGIYFHNYGNLVRAGHHGFSASHTLADVDLVMEKIDTVLRRMKG